MLHRALAATPAVGRTLRMAARFGVAGAIVASSIPAALAIPWMGIPAILVVPVAFFVGGAVAGAGCEAVYPGAIWRYGLAFTCIGVVWIVLGPRAETTLQMTRVAIAFGVAFLGAAMFVATLPDDRGRRVPLRITSSFAGGAVAATLATLVLSRVGVEARGAAGLGLGVGSAVIGILLPTAPKDPTSAKR